MDKLLKWNDVFPTSQEFVDYVQGSTETILNFGYTNGILMDLYTSLYELLSIEYGNRYWRYLDQEEAQKQFLKLWITTVPQFMIDIAYLDEEFWQSLYQSEKRIGKDIVDSSATNETSNTSHSSGTSSDTGATSTNSTTNTTSTDTGETSSTSTTNSTNENTGATSTNTTNNTSLDGAESTTPYNTGTSAKWNDGKDVPSKKTKTFGNDTAQVSGKTTQNGKTNETSDSSGNTTQNSEANQTTSQSGKTTLNGETSQNATSSGNSTNSGLSTTSNADYFINLLKIRTNDFDFKLREFMSGFTSLFVKFYTLKYKANDKGIF